MIRPEEESNHKHEDKGAKYTSAVADLEDARDVRRIHALEPIFATIGVRALIVSHDKDARTITR